jgi:hypothetical protein
MVTPCANCSVLANRDAYKEHAEVLFAHKNQLAPRNARPWLSGWRSWQVLGVYIDHFCPKPPARFWPKFCIGCLRRSENISIQSNVNSTEITQLEHAKFVPVPCFNIGLFPCSFLSLQTLATFSQVIEVTYIFVSCCLYLKSTFVPLPSSWSSIIIIIIICCIEILRQKAMKQEENVCFKSQKI